MQKMWTRYKGEKLMRKLFKVLLVVVAGLLLFTGGAFAANQGWLNFTGDEQVQQSESNVNEIMEILRNVHKGKLDAEQALAELEKLDPKGLQKELEKIQKDYEKLAEQYTKLARTNENLKTQLKELEDNAEYVNHLEKELQRANQLVEQLKSETDKALEEAKTYE